MSCTAPVATAWTAAAAVGPFIAGLLIAWIDTDIYQLLAILSLVGGLAVFVLPAMTVRRPSGRGLAQLLEGIRYVYRNPYVFPSIFLDMVIVHLI